MKSLGPSTTPYVRSPGDEAPERPRPRLDTLRKLVRGIRYCYREWLTGPGRALLWLGLLALAMAYVVIFFRAFGDLSIFLIICSAFVLSIPFGLFRARFAIGARELLARTTCGERFQYRVTLSNASDRAGRDIVVREALLPAASRPDRPKAQGAYVRYLGPGDHTQVTLSLDFHRRGLYVFPGVRVETLFPFGLIRWGETFPQPTKVLVYPAFYPLGRFPVDAPPRYQPEGLALVSSVGESGEFIGTREYRDGDPLRKIHWPSYARLGKPIVKEYQEEYFIRIALLLDTFIPPRSSPRVRDDFEAAVSVCASITNYLAQQEYVIDLFAAGPNIYHLTAGRSLALFEGIMDVLACLEPSETDPLGIVEPELLDHVAQTSLVIAVLHRWDPHCRSVLQKIEQLGTAVHVVLVSRDQPRAPTLPTTHVVDPSNLRDGLAELF